MGLNESRAHALLAVDGGATVDIAKLHTGLLRQLLDGLRERQVIHALDKVDDVSTFAATEAVPHAAARSDVETRGLLVMKGTQALEAAAAGRLQGDVFANYIIDAGAFANEGNVLVAYPAGHGLILGSSPAPRVSARAAYATARG